MSISQVPHSSAVPGSRSSDNTRRTVVADILLEDIDCSPGIGHTVVAAAAMRHGSSRLAVAGVDMVAVADHH